MCLCTLCHFIDTEQATADMSIWKKKLNKINTTNLDVKEGRGTFKMK